jgi:hypothetical protein
MLFFVFVLNFDFFLGSELSNVNSFVVMRKVLL